MDESLASLFIPGPNLARIDEPTCTDALLAQTADRRFFDDDEYDRKLARKEKQALIEEAARKRQRDAKRYLCCFGFWFVFFALLMSGVVFLSTRRDIPTQIKEVLEQDENINWKNDLGVVDCHRLAKRGILFHSDVKNENFSSLSFKSPAVFILKDDTDLTMEEACGLESIARLLAELMVYSVQLKCKKSPVGPPTNKYKTILADSYKNIMALNVDGKKFFRKTPLSGRWMCGSSLAVKQAMLITAWRFGGLVIHPGIALNNRTFIHFSAKEVHISDLYIASYKNCDPSVYYFLNALAQQPKKDTVFDISKRAKELFDSLCCSGVCPDIITDDGTKVCDKNCPLTMVNNSTDLLKTCPYIGKAVDDTYRTSNS